MQGLFEGRTKARPGLVMLAALAAAVTLSACWAEEAEFVDPGATETSASPAQSAKVDVPEAAKTEKKMEPAAPAPKVAQPEAPAKAEAPAAKSEKTEPVAVAPKAEPSESGAKAEQPAVTQAAVRIEDADEDDDEIIDTSIQPVVALDAMINPPLPEEEKALYDLIRSAYKAPGEVGAQTALKGKVLADISARASAVQALERNLPLQISAHETEFRRAALQEAKAAFLPVFTLSAQYNNTNTFERLMELTLMQKIAKQGLVKLKQDIPGGKKLAPNGHPIVASVAFFKPGEIVFVSPTDNAHYYEFSGDSSLWQFPTTSPPLAPTDGTKVADPDQVKAFAADKNLKLGYIDPSGHAQQMPKSWNYKVASPKTFADPRGSMSLTVTQQLPWGPALSITTTPAYHNQTYDQFGNTFDHPYFTTGSVGVFLPLPCTKNFGPYAPADVAIKLAKQSKEIALWDFKAAINSILRTTDALYLNLVHSVMDLDAAIGNRKTVETLVGQTGQVLGAGRTTQFGKDQVDGELQRVKVTEEAAWNNYIAASDALVELLNMDRDTLLMPVGYRKSFDDHLQFDAAQAIAAGMENRPELKSASAATKASQISVKFARQQERPDLSANANVTVSQTQVANGEGFRGTGGIGYKSLDESLTRMFHEDVLDESYSATFRRPLFQRAENARIQKAEGALKQQQFTTQITENRVRQDIGDALARLSSAKASVEAAKARRDFARKAYLLTVDMQREGRVTEFEMIAKSQDLYNAEYAVNSELADYKQAETQLLYAQGTLASQYPERTAPNEFDRYRLGLLKASQALQFFGDRKETKAP